MKLQHLKKLPIFSRFKKEELEIFTQGTRELVLQRAHELFRAGDTRDTFFILLKGEIEIVKKIGGNSEVVSIVAAGEYIAEEALFARKTKHSHTAVVRNENARVLTVKRSSFEKLSEYIRLKFILNLLSLISENFEHASTVIVTLAQIGKLLGVGEKVTVFLLAKKILDILLQSTKAERGAIAILENGPRYVKMRAIAGFSDDAFLNKTIILSEDPIASRIVKDGETVNLREAEYLPGAKKVLYARRSLLGAPLLVAGRSIGAILLMDRAQEGGFTQNDETLISIVAHTVALAIHHAEHIEIKEAEAELKREYVV